LSILVYLIKITLLQRGRTCANVDGLDDLLVSFHFPTSRISTYQFSSSSRPFTCYLLPIPAATYHVDSTVKPVFN